jgi:hypothetical protein
MALAYKIGDKVREKVFVMADGEVTSATIGDTDGIVYFKVKYTDGEGEIQERYIAEDLLEGVIA